MTVSIVMLLILLPVRIVWYQFISTHWSTSVGIISGITITMIYLSEKNKLGKFSGMFKRQMSKFHKGKRKYYVYTMTAIQFFLLINIIYAIEVANIDYKQTKSEVESIVPQYNSIDDILKDTKKVEPQDYLMAFVAWAWLYIYHYDVYVSLISVLNDMTHGYLQHFSFVFLIEAFELTGIIIYTHWKSKKYQIESS